MYEKHTILTLGLARDISRYLMTFMHKRHTYSHIKLNGSIIIVNMAPFNNTQRCVYPCDNYSQEIIFSLFWLLWHDTLGVPKFRWISKQNNWQFFMLYWIRCTNMTNTITLILVWLLDCYCNDFFYLLHWFTSIWNRKDCC